jgi:hypothetical protein
MVIPKESNFTLAGAEWIGYNQGSKHREQPDLLESETLHLMILAHIPA